MNNYNSHYNFFVYPHLGGGHQINIHNMEERKQMTRHFIFGAEANKGFSVRVLQTRAGHSSIQTTAQYVDVNEGMLVSAMELA